MFKLYGFKHNNSEVLFRFDIQMDFKSDKTFNRL